MFLEQKKPCKTRSLQGFFLIFNTVYYRLKNLTDAVFDLIKYIPEGK